jgi:ABC-type multidrug transport system fused ATPase/permease subunit
MMEEAWPWRIRLFAGAILVAVSSACRVRLPALLGDYLDRLASVSTSRSMDAPAAAMVGWRVGFWTRFQKQAHIRMQPDAAGITEEDFGRELMWLLAIMATIASCEGANRMLMFTTGESLVKQVRRQLYEALLSSGLATHTASATGQRTEKLNHDVANIQVAVSIVPRACSPLVQTTCHMVSYIGRVL